MSATVDEMLPDASTSPAVRGWCPSAYAPMETGDGWIVRARVGCRPVSADQWDELAELAETFGNGLIELTMRGNLQLRGVPERLTGDAGRRLVAVGLAGHDEADDRRRMVVVNPLERLARADRTAPGESVPDRVKPAAVTAADVTACIEELLVIRGGELPAKWWGVVDVDTDWPMPVDGCDVALVEQEHGWRVLLAGREYWSGSDPRALVADVVERCAQRRCRARDLDVRSLQSGCDRELDPSGVQVTVGSSATSDRSVRASWRGTRTLGEWVAAAVSPPFGVARPEALRVLASMAAWAEVSVHPTPERGVVLVAPVRTGDAVARCLDDLDRLGWVTDDDDPRRLVSACIGTHGCAASLIDTWQVASDLIAGGGVSERVHVSGCAKRCGAPAGAKELVASTTGVDVIVSGSEQQ